MTSKISEQDQEIINLINKYTSKTKEDEEKNPLQKIFSINFLFSFPLLKSFIQNEM